METLEQRIKRFREERGLSQQHVADKVGVSRVAVTKWESGQTANLKLGNLLSLCSLFSVSVEELIRGNERGACNMETKQTKEQLNAQELEASAKKNAAIIDEGIAFQTVFMNSEGDVKEVAKFVLLGAKEESPEWADADARAYVDSLKYKATKWLSSAEKKTGTR